MWIIERVCAVSGQQVPLCAHENMSLIEAYAAVLEALRKEIIKTQNIELPREYRIDPRHYWAFDNPTFLEDVTFKMEGIPTYRGCWDVQEENCHEF
jgi:hypothetical protein